MFEFIWNCIVTVGGAIVNLVTNLVQAGIELVCTLTTSLASKIRAAVNEIANAFDTFVAWAEAFSWPIGT